VECAPGLKIFTTTILAASDRIGIILRQRHAHPEREKEREREREVLQAAASLHPRLPHLSFLRFGPSRRTAREPTASRISERVFSPNLVLISSDVL